MKREGTQQKRLKGVKNRSTFPLGYNYIVCFFATMTHDHQNDAKSSLSHLYIGKQ